MRESTIQGESMCRSVSTGGVFMQRTVKLYESSKECCVCLIVLKGVLPRHTSKMTNMRMYINFHHELHKCVFIFKGDMNNTDKASSSVRDQLVYFNRVISQLDLINPTADVTCIFNQLITFCCSTTMPSSTFECLCTTDAVFKASCENLSRLLSRYEYQLETSWAKTYAFSKHLATLESFPDINDYRSSIQLEVEMLCNVGVQFMQSSTPIREGNAVVTKMAFIGSGPLPISSMLISSEYAPFTDIYNIDLSEEANQLASLASCRLLPENRHTRMHFVTCDVSQRSALSELGSVLKTCQLIFIAALVGASEQAKLDILENLVSVLSADNEANTIQHIVIRTTNGLRQVLYPKLSVQTIAALQPKNGADPDQNRRNMLQIESVVHPRSDTRMSLIVIKKS